MTDWVIAAYFGIGVWLIQTFDTAHSAGTYGQKKVPFLEMVPGFSRVDPDDPALVSPPIPPWRLPHIQIREADSTRYQKWVGLHATNLFYCYAMAVIYGLIATGIVRLFVPSLVELSLSTLLQFAVLFAVLHVFSLVVVGSGVAVTLLEGNLAFNVLVLSVLSGGVLNYNGIIGLLQFGAALTIGPLVFWLNFQYDQGHIQIGNLMPIYYLLIPVLYSEFLVLTLGLLYT